MTDRPEPLLDARLGILRSMAQSGHMLSCHEAMELIDELRAARDAIEAQAAEIEKMKTEMRDLAPGTASSPVPVWQG